MSAILVVAFVLLVITPVAGFFLYAGALLFTLRRFKIRSLRFRVVAKITVLLCIASIVLLTGPHVARIDAWWWSVLANLAVFALFIALLRRYAGVRFWRGFGIVVATTALATVGVVLLVLAIVLPLRLYVASPFEVNGESMMPAYASGDILFVDRLSRRAHNPERGDVVVLVSPEPSTTAQFYVKRIIALPGERVQARSGKVFVTNAMHPTGYELPEPYIVSGTVTEDLSDDPVTVPENAYFVLGDNREHSNDSRYWGPLPRDHIVGIVAMKIWPPVHTPGASA